MKRQRPRAESVPARRRAGGVATGTCVPRWRMRSKAMPPTSVEPSQLPQESSLPECRPPRMPSWGLRKGIGKIGGSASCWNQRCPFPDPADGCPPGQWCRSRGGGCKRRTFIAPDHCGPGSSPDCGVIPMRKNSASSSSAWTIERGCPSPVKRSISFQTWRSVEASRT